jgi:hypothetical protein
VFLRDQLDVVLQAEDDQGFSLAEVDYQVSLLD